VTPRPTVNLIDRNPWPAMVAGCVLFWAMVAAAGAADITEDASVKFFAKLTETSSAGGFADSKGNVANGTWVGDTFTTIAAPAQFGSLTCPSFNGTNQTIQWSDDVDVEMTAAGDFTWAYWAKTNTASTVFPVAKNDAGFTAEFDLGTNAGSPYSVLRPVGVNFQPGTPDYNDNGWHHIAHVGDRGASTVVVKHYIDGVLVSTSSAITWTPSTSSDPLYIGSRRGAGGWWVGGLGFVLKADKAFSDAEVLQLYQWTGSAPNKFAGRKVGFVGR
jgi:hypothetical protein